MTNDKSHEPVMVAEVLQYLGTTAHLHSQIRIIDATLGLGGHSEKLLEKGYEVLGIETDETILALANERLAGFKGFHSVNSNFTKIKSIATENNFNPCSGILFDLGVNSVQLTSDTRGLSYQHTKAPLDMRLSMGQAVMASDLLNTLREDQLEDLFMQVLGKFESTRLAKKVVARRQITKFETVGDFESLIGEHKALPFMALRMAVNSEIDNLASALPDAFELLLPGGVMVVISFHSGEDRIVKRFFGELEKSGEVVELTDGAVKPTAEEISSNPRARSAKMRVIQKINI